MRRWQCGHRSLVQTLVLFSLFRKNSFRDLLNEILLVVFFIFLSGIDNQMRGKLAKGNLSEEFSLEGGMWNS